MSETVSIAIVVCAGIVLVVGLLVGVPIWLYHRRELIKLQTGNPNAERVLARIDALEARCKSIEDKLNDR